MPLDPEFGKLLREKRETARIPQTACARQMGWRDSSAWNAVERGRQVISEAQKTKMLAAVEAASANLAAILQFARAPRRPAAPDLSTLLRRIAAMDPEAAQTVGVLLGYHETHPDAIEAAVTIRALSLADREIAVTILDRAQVPPAAPKIQQVK
jgi:hypothetical protein